MDDSQLLRGILEGCVLAVIARGETYGYKLLSELSECGFEGLFEGTLYPVITRLEKKEYVSCRREKSPLGPMRTYYTVTEKGLSALQGFKESYISITAAAKRALGEEEEK